MTKKIDISYFYALVKVFLLKMFLYWSEER